MIYFWVIIGMELWGGKIYEGNVKIDNTPFADLDYFPNNFNNFPRAFVTIFELLMVNNWQVIASAYVAISGNVAWIYFISFNLWAVIVTLKFDFSFFNESNFIYSFLNKLVDGNNHPNIQYFL